MLRRAVISVAQGLLVASLCGCPGSGGKRVPDGGGRAEGTPSDRSCSAKIAFRFRDEGAQKLRVRAVWLSDQPEPVMSDPEDTEPESEE